MAPNLVTGARRERAILLVDGVHAKVVGIEPGGEQKATARIGCETARGGFGGPAPDRRQQAGVRIDAESGERVALTFADIEKASIGPCCGCRRRWPR
jgi:hypothetical protein